jgi:hypothetical protein
MTPYEVAKRTTARAQARQLRVELVWLRARYDCGAISAAVFTVVKRLECDIAWAEHQDRSDQR